MRWIAMVLLATVACGGSSANTPGSGAGGVCEDRDDPFGPYTLDAGPAAARYGRGGTKYSEMPSTLEKPIEVCGVRGEIQWMKSHTCADGRQVANLNAQTLAGTGGRCGTPIDVYEAPCSEGAVKIYLDMYLCGPGERFM